MCFSCRFENKMVALASDWLRHFRLLLESIWTEFYDTWQEARYQRFIKFVFFGPIRKTRWEPGLWLTETIRTFLKLLNVRNLTGSKVSMSFIKLVFFGLIGKKRWLPWPLIGWVIFDFADTPKQNSTKLDRKQEHHVLYQVCVFRTDR